MSKVAQKTSKRSSVIPEAPASKQDDERSAAERFAGYAGSVAEHVDISREALNELFSACTILWTIVASSSSKADMARARVQWDRAIEAFVKGSKFAAIAANDLDDATIREVFDDEADEDTNVENTLSRAAE